jgi:hypothetical protein
MTLPPRAPGRVLECLGGVTLPGKFRSPEWMMPRTLMLSGPSSSPNVLLTSLLSSTFKSIREYT